MLGRLQVKEHYSQKLETYVLYAKQTSTAWVGRVRLPTFAMKQENIKSNVVLLFQSPEDRHK